MDRKLLKNSALCPQQSLTTRSYLQQREMVPLSFQAHLLRGQSGTHWGVTFERQTIQVSLNAVKGLIHDVIIGNALAVEGPGSLVSHLHKNVSGSSQERTECQVILGSQSITSDTENYNGRRTMCSINEMPQTRGPIKSTPDLDQDPHQNPSSLSFWLGDLSRTPPVVISVLICKMGQHTP